VIYFAQAPDTGAIKIGFTEQDPRDRVRRLGRAGDAPNRLLATFPGGYDQERRFHGLFRRDHLGGEWFRPSPLLMKLIKKLGTSDIDRQKDARRSGQARKEQMTLYLDEGTATYLRKRAKRLGISIGEAARQVIGAGLDALAAEAERVAAQNEAMG